MDMSVCRQEAGRIGVLATLAVDPMGQMPRLATLLAVASLPRSCRSTLRPSPCFKSRGLPWPFSLHDACNFH